MFIKTRLLKLMCSASAQPRIQALCSESITLIAAIDFPKEWQNLLPDLVEKFTSDDPAVICGALQTTNAIFKRFRYVERSDALYEVIIIALDVVQEPLLTLVQSIGQTVEATANDATELRPLMEALRLINRIFFSLNYQELFFEDHMEHWMAEFARHLTYRIPNLEDRHEFTQPGPVDQLQTSVIQGLSICAEKDEEAFIPFLSSLIPLIWNLLMRVTAHPKHDMLATTSIKFLTTLIEKSIDIHLFQDEATLRLLVTDIVIPNIMVREIDHENFEDNPTEFILTELEGRDAESRRGCSQLLLRAMCRDFEAQTTTICLEHIGTMFGEFMADPTNKWTLKDGAVRKNYLMLQK